ncbi:ThuA domain-containing protein [Psychrosphaera algicola]|uniref:ThuA domain-containing protein n=1 Tax=Psychrosphaera algicola TaxID=3023714 RepID=A0ABT5F7Q3_9GAMM|nr:ThuA domain-containing protein [Psychrosphaera sp. G1-22]MDC2887565.1 ThuA domain-containing protein [Psychrosphaera sp. G1-22]
MKLKLMPLVLCYLLLSCSVINKAEPKLKVLIIDGQNNHAIWPKTTQMMKVYLESIGQFEVDIYRTQFTWMGKDLITQFPAQDGRTHQATKQPKHDPTFSPTFLNYDVVISNFGWQAAPWPESTQLAFEQYMKNGGGFVTVHAANNSFPQWVEYNKMIGLGGWGGRTEKDGPYLYFDDAGELQRDMTPGNGGGHGHQHEFDIQVRNKNHPIMQDLPTSWRHSKDELYNRLRGPAENLTILATAYDDKKFNGFGRNEPVFMTIKYHKGRVFHTTLGHDSTAFQDTIFMSILAKGTRWAAGLE